MHWIKEHPYLTGGLILAVIIFFALRSKASAASSNGPNGVVTVGPSDSTQALALQANAGVQAATLGAQTQVAGYNAAVNITQLQTSADVIQAGYARDVQLANIYEGYGAENNRTAAALALGLAQLGQTPNATAAGATPTPASAPTQVAVVGPATVSSNLSTIGASQNAVVNNFSGQPVTIPNIYSAAGDITQAPASASPVDPSQYSSYDAYHAAVLSTLTPCSAPFDPACVAANGAIINASNNAFLSDPNSPHNMVPGSTPNNSAPAAPATPNVSFGTLRGFGNSNISSAPAAGPVYAGR